MFGFSIKKNFLYNFINRIIYCWFLLFRAASISSTWNWPFWATKRKLFLWKSIYVVISISVNFVFWVKKDRDFANSLIILTQRSPTHTREEQKKKWNHTLDEARVNTMFLWHRCITFCASVASLFNRVCPELNKTKQNTLLEFCHACLLFTGLD